eukprot:8343347-Pyramimonas_sp.AAC.1
MTTFRGPIGSSTEGPSGGVHMRPRHRFQRTPRTFRGPTGGSTESGTRNAALATAYGWVLPQADVSPLSFRFPHHHQPHPPHPHHPYVVYTLPFYRIHIIAFKCVCLFSFTKQFAEMGAAVVEADYGREKGKHILKQTYYSQPSRLRHPHSSRFRS